MYSIAQREPPSGYELIITDKPWSIFMKGCFSFQQGLRAQIDRKLYKKHMQELLNNYPNLEIRAASVHDLIWKAPDASTPTSSGVWAQVGGVRLGMRH